MKTRAKLIVSLTVVSMVLGFMVALQYRQTAANRSAGLGLSYGDTAERQLQTQLTAVTQANQQQQQQLAQITTQLTAYEQQSAGSNSALQKLQQRLQAERILAGLTPVTGPGVTVTLMDGIATNGNTEQVLTHDWDVRSVINELFTAGAEAISINHYRVVATSGVKCIGPVVSVNDHRLGAPFVIQAIGDPQTLASALDLQGGVLDWLRGRGIQVSDPQTATVITMPAFTASTTTGSSS